MNTLHLIISFFDICKKENICGRKFAREWYDVQNTPVHVWECVYIINMLAYQIIFYEQHLPLTKGKYYYLHSFSSFDIFYFWYFSIEKLNFSQYIVTKR